MTGIYRFMRIQIFQIKCSKQGVGGRHNHENTSDLFSLSCLLGHGTLDANRMQIYLIESGDAEVIVFEEMSKTFFPLLYHYQWGVFFMKSVLNKSYHRSQAFWSSFVTCGCGCVFNFLSIKSKYAVFFCFPPLWNLNKRSQHKQTGEEYSFCCCLIQQALMFFAFFFFYRPSQ